jgi:hypothetical protein
MTSRELVYKTLDFQKTTERVPRDMWLLDWASINYPAEVKQLQKDFPNDFGRPNPCYKVKDISQGNAQRKGIFVDQWGCIFENLQDGYVGEVKEALVSLDDEEWSDTSRIHIPKEWFTVDIPQVNAQCQASEKFMMSPILARPFEQLQFIRTTEQLFCDLVLMPEGLKGFIKKMHGFYCDLLELWAKTDVDALFIMDDWGSQNTLLINPLMWEELFKPMYKDYIQIAHRGGKKIFMHSDGNILAIYPHLIELGLDAINSQIFCMGLENLKPFAGEITFWGEIDRQHILPYATEDEVKKAVYSIQETLGVNGGVIGQCEFGPGTSPANVHTVFKTWNEI